MGLVAEEQIVDEISADRRNLQACQQRQMTVLKTLDKIEADIVTVTRREKSDRLSARVRLRFRLSDQQDEDVGEMFVSIELIEKESYRWRRTKRQIIDTAWEWLDGYFDGASLGFEGENLFSDILDGKHRLSYCGLTQEEEHSLQQELLKIEREVAV